MHIRPAIDEDIGQLLGLIRALTAEEPDNGMSAMTTGLLREQVFRREPPAFVCVVAESYQATLTGFATYRVVEPGTTPGRTMHVMNVFVARPRRRQRIGEGLMRDVARQAIRLGCGAVTWPVDASTPHGRLFSAYLGARTDESGTQFVLPADAIQVLATGPSGHPSPPNRSVAEQLAWPVTFHVDDGRQFCVRRSAPPTSLLVLEVNGLAAPFVLGGYAGETTTEAIIRRTLHWWAHVCGESLHLARVPAATGSESQEFAERRPQASP